MTGNDYPGWPPPHRARCLPTRPAEDSRCDHLRWFSARSQRAHCRGCAARWGCSRRACGRVPGRLAMNRSTQRLSRGAGGSKTAPLARAIAGEGVRRAVRARARPRPESPTRNVGAPAIRVGERTAGTDRQHGLAGPREVVELRMNPGCESAGGSGNRRRGNWRQPRLPRPGL